MVEAIIKDISSCMRKKYSNEFKAQAVKLAQKIGGHKAANELGIPKGTMYTWIKAFKEDRLSANEAVHTPKNGKLYVSAIFDCYDLAVLGLKRQQYYDSLQDAA